MKRDMTGGAPTRVMLAFFIPVLLGNLLQQFYNIADTAIVGKFVGKEALAAVGSIGSVHFLIFGFAGGMCAGFCIPVARQFGARDMRGVRVCVANILYLCVAMSVLLSVGMALMSGTILRWMNTPEDMYRHAWVYLTIILAGIGVTVFYNILAGICRALGDSRTPLIFLAVAAVLNVGLDLLFVCIFHWGTAGAAWATVLAQGVAGIACLLYMLRRFPELRLKREDVTPDRVTLLELLRMGLPMALQFSITALGSIILQSAINPLGSPVVAAMTAAQKIQMILFQPLEALGATIATYVSQNLGAQKLRRIRMGVGRAMRMAMVFAAIMYATAVTIGPTCAQILFLSPDEPELVSIARQYLTTVSLAYPALGVLMVLRNAVQGLGYALPAMAAGLVEMLARVIVGVWLVPVGGFSAVVLAHPSAWVAAALLLIPVYYRVIALLKMKIPEKPPLQQASG